MTREPEPWFPAHERAERYRMLCKFASRDADAGSVVFTDILPPFGVVEIAESTWADLGEPSELRVTLETLAQARASHSQKEQS